MGLSENGEGIKQEPPPKTKTFIDTDNNVVVAARGKGARGVEEVLGEINGDE